METRLRHVRLVPLLLLMLTVLLPAAPAFAQTPPAKELAVPTADLGDGWNVREEIDRGDSYAIVSENNQVGLVIFQVVVTDSSQQAEGGLGTIPQQLQDEGYAVQPKEGLGDGTAYRATATFDNGVIATAYWFRIQYVVVGVEVVGLAQDSQGVEDRAWLNVGRQHDRLRTLVQALPIAGPFCEPGQPVAYPIWFAVLRAHLGEAMGDPTECPHVDEANGHLFQATTAGVGEVPAATGLPAFTNGWDHWALTSQGMVHWTGAESSPPQGSEILPVKPQGPLPAELQPTMDLLRATPAPESTGKANWAEVVEDWLSRDGTNVVIAPLTAYTAGVYIGATHTLFITPEVLADVPAAQAAVLVHEARHSAQISEGDRDCVHREVNAHAWEALIWDALTNGGIPQPTTWLQASANAVLSILASEGEPGLYKYVVENPSYQDQCRLWTPAA
jgi:hypothetical protein